MPAIVRWPNFIPAGSVSDELCTLMDLHPTFAKLAGAQLPERKRDGQNIWPVWSPRNAKSPHDHFFYYHTHSLQAVRDTRWKLVLGQTRSSTTSKPTPLKKPISPPNTPKSFNAFKPQQLGQRRNSETENSKASVSVQ